MFAPEMYDPNPYDPNPYDRDPYGPGDDPRAGDWSEARCRDVSGATTRMFFSEEIPAINAAKALCEPCTLRSACLAGALARREPWGVWGGQLFANGKVLAQKRRRGRPPKHPRPDDVVVSAVP